MATYKIKLPLGKSNVESGKEAKLSVSVPSPFILHQVIVSTNKQPGSIEVSLGSNVLDVSKRETLGCVECTLVKPQPLSQHEVVSVRFINKGKKTKLVAVAFGSEHEAQK
jgi:hypothetical protein